MGGFVTPTQRLLHARASVRAKDLSDKSPLHYAVLGGHLEVTQILLDAKGEIDAKEEYGKTPLMIASQQGHVALCRELIERGANVNAQEQLLKTSLMLACEHAHSEVVDLLIKRGARADLHDAQGFDAAYYAEASGQEDVKSHLEAAPSVATWDVGDDDEDDNEPKADAVDYIAEFKVTNERSESPVTVLSQQEIKEVKQSNGLSRDDSNEIKELEEENEVLNEELRQVNLDHKKAVDRIASMEQHIQQLTSGVKENSHNKEYENELETVKAQLAKEKTRNTEANEELSALRARLESDGGITDDDGDDADNDSWGDSDGGDLFDLPSTGMSPGKVKVLKKNTSRTRSAGSDSKIIGKLETQVADLEQENEDLKRRLEFGNTETIPLSEYEDLRKSSESRITNLEEEIADLKDELQERNNKMVPADEYEQLQKSNKRESRIMQEQLAMLADEMASTTEKLAHVTDNNDRLKRSMSMNSSQQLKDLLREKSELEGAINKYTVSMADQSEETQRLHKKCQQTVAEKKQLQDQLTQQSEVIQTKTQEYETLEKECVRLQNMISKQSKAIATQNDKARKNKQTLVDLMSEKETLAEELHRLKRDDHGNGDEGSVSKAKYDEVMEENRTLKETVSSQEGTLQGSQGDRDRLDFLTKENWRLQGALRRQEDAMSKKHAELKRYKKLAQAQGDKDVEEFSTYVEELDAENLKLQEELDQCKIELRGRDEDAKKFAELKSENERLREDARPKGIADTTADKKRYKTVLEENAKLKDELKKQKEATSHVNGMPEKDEKRLQKEVDDLNGKLMETVRVYRAHLLCAVQGNLDPEVKMALMEIVKLRNNGHSVA
ncbi:uncharacterized protein [Amphiura filiformis]